jgi:peptide/nickel transport system substrate-binding protein
MDQLHTDALTSGSGKRGREPLEPRAFLGGKKGERFPPPRVRVCVFAACLSAVALSLGCSSRSTPQEPAVALRVGLGVGGTALATALPNLVDTLTGEPLVVTGWNGRPQPKLASEWNWSDEGRTLRVRLQQGVVFHDGTPLTAAAVVADLTRRLGEPGYARVESINAEGNDTVVFHLKEPDAFLLAELVKASIKTGDRRSLGTGPFLIKSRTPDVVFESFANYHLGRPAISKVVVRTYETPRASWAAMMRGEIDFLQEVNRDAVEFLEAGNSVQTFSFPRPYYTAIIFNMNHPILSRRVVRQAINEAIDRGKIVTAALNNRGQPANGPIWPYHWAYHSATSTYAYNPDAARLRLDGAGLALGPATGGEMPRRFRFKCVFWSEDPQFERIALVVQKQLFEIGIDVEMVPMTLRDLQQRLSDGDFETVLIPMVSGRALEWTYVFWRSAPKPMLRSGYAAADAALDRLRAARSDDETRIAVADLQRIMYEDPPAAFLVRPETARAVNDLFVVPAEAKGRDIVSTLWQWKPRASVPSRAAR